MSNAAQPYRFYLSSIRLLHTCTTRNSLSNLHYFSMLSKLQLVLPTALPSTSADQLPTPQPPARLKPRTPKQTRLHPFGHRQQQGFEGASREAGALSGSRAAMNRAQAWMPAGHRLSRELSPAAGPGRAEQGGSGASPQPRARRPDARGGPTAAPSRPARPRAAPGSSPHLLLQLSHQHRLPLLRLL